MVFGVIFFYICLFHNNKTRVMSRLFITAFILSLAINAFPQWQFLTTPVTSSFRNIDFLDASTGMVVGTDGCAISTEDGGLSWTVINLGTTTNLSDVVMVDEDIVYISGDYGFMVKSTDGGMTWNSQYTGINDLIIDMEFISEETGFFCGEDGAFGKTVDGGNTWIADPLGTYWLRSVSFPTENTGYCVGDYGSIWKTTDGGASWTFLNAGTFEHLIRVFFISEETGYISGDNGTILKTTNGGSSWSIINAGTSGYLSGMYFFNADLGYILDMYGTLFQTEDGGQSWYPEPLNAGANTVRIKCISEESVYICGANGLVMKRCNAASAAFTYSKENLSVSFENQSLYGESFFWDFGDGYSSTLENPSHTYQSAGNYHVCLEVFNGCMDDSTCQNINITTSGISGASPGTFSVFPNPATGHFTIQVPSDALPAIMRITDMKGKLLSVIPVEPGSSTCTPDLLLCPGIYLVSMQSGDRAQVQKLVISR